MKKSVLGGPSLSRIPVYLLSPHMRFLSYLHIFSNVVFFIWNTPCKNSVNLVNLMTTFPFFNSCLKCQASCFPPPRVCHTYFYAPISLWNNWIIKISPTILCLSLCKCSGQEHSSIYKLWSGCEKISQSWARSIESSVSLFKELLWSS